MANSDVAADDRVNEVNNFITNPWALLLCALVWLSGGGLVAACWWYASTFMRVVWASVLLLWIVLSPLLLTCVLLLVSFVLILSNRPKLAELIGRIAADFMPFAWLPFSAAGVSMPTTPMEMYGMCLIANNKFNEAVEVGRSALARVESIHGKVSPHLIDALISLSDSCKYAGHFAEAQELLDRALAISRTEADEVNRLISARRTHGQYGNMYRSVLMFDLAIKNFENAIEDNNRLKEIGTSVLGIAQDTAVKQQNLSDAFTCMNRLEEADRMLAEAEPFLKKKGREAFLLEFNRCAAVLRAKQLRFEEADAYLKDAVYFTQKMANSVLSERLSTQACTAFVEQAKGNSKEALELYKKVLVLSHQVYGAEHISTAEIMFDFATCLDSNACTEEAHAMREQANVIKERVWEEMRRK